MPRWTDPEPMDGGGVRHRLDGSTTAAVVETFPRFGRTTISVAVVIDGTSDADVTRAKIDAEMLIGTALRRRLHKEATR